MASMRLLGVLLITFAFSLTCSLATFTPRPIRHYVNGRQGWVPHPLQDYNQWAGNNRFLVHDTLYFRYNNEQDSVLEVSKEDYDSCNTDHPIEKKQDGESEFELKQPGPYYFITGNKTHCQQGQKLIVQVLHYPSSFPSPPQSSPSPSSPGAHHPHPLPPPGAPSPKGSPGPTFSPGSPVMSPPGATSPSSGTPGSSGPATSPSSGTPGSSGPSTSPTSGTPSTSGPATAGPGLSPSGTASPPSPVAAGPGSSAPEAAGGPRSSETPSGQPSDLTSPSPSATKKSAAVRSNGFSMGVGVLSVLVSFFIYVA